MDFITRTIFGKEYRSLSSSLCSFLHSVLPHTSCVGVCMCEFCNVWVWVCVGVLVICVLVFTVFLYCFVYVYLFFLCFCLILSVIYFYCYVYVFLFLCMLCSVYSVLIVPAGTLRLPWLRFFRAFSSVLRQMPVCNSQTRGTALTLPNS